MQPRTPCLEKLAAVIVSYLLRRSTALEKDAATLRAPNKAIMAVKRRFFEDLYGTLASMAARKSMRQLPSMGTDPKSVARNVRYMKRMLLKALKENNVKGAKDISKAIKDTQLVYALPSMYDIGKYAKDPRKIVHVRNVPVSVRDFNQNVGTTRAWYNRYLVPDGERLKQRHIDRLVKLFGVDPNKPVVYFPTFRGNNGRALWDPQVLLHEFGHAYDDAHGGVENYMRYFSHGARRAQNPYGANVARGSIPIKKLLRDETLSLSIDPTLRQEFAASLAAGGRAESAAFKAILVKYRLSRAMKNWGRNMGLSDLKELVAQSKKLWKHPTDYTYDSLQPLRVGWGRKQDKVIDKVIKEIGNAGKQ